MKLLLRFLFVIFLLVLFLFIYFFISLYFFLFGLGSFFVLFITIYYLKKRGFSRIKIFIICVPIFFLYLCLALFVTFSIEAYTQKEITKQSAGDCRISNTKIGYQTNLPLYLYDQGDGIYHIFALGEDGKIVDKSNLNLNKPNDNGETLAEYEEKLQKKGRIHNLIMTAQYNKDGFFQIKVNSWYDTQTYIYIINLFSQYIVYKYILDLQNYNIKSDVLENKIRENRD
ncbi:hypothetical protein CPU12_01295 [Malaciobacter molluscorum LMG 25693]|uniref:Membrane protein n=1 Tax=Malaciobacter molluscorum LMG 25693 TaxID=870501 RepID=A0A2G1DLR1_9BACT|nr:hypothetical protein [Malaciobacter molluscorum]AXX92215.1 putative membrane protein [Malaciobacter molluscorum LMG 25693]PHO19443.1 hypothetical protein CPU12_01295 [Malaciobacter molluscorum LMG 25693]